MDKDSQKLTSLVLTHLLALETAFLISVSFYHSLSSGYQLRNGLLHSEVFIPISNGVSLFIM